MQGRELPLRTGSEVARVVRALGKHRYVKGRLLLAHAFVFDALAGQDEILAAARTWAERALADTSIDPASRDERLFRACSEAEVALTLERFWDPRERQPRERLERRLAMIDIDLGSARPFDETCEDDIFPLLVDAGWELLTLAELEPDRHQGVIGAFGEGLSFETAKFEESSRFEPEPYLQELPAFGPQELLGAVDEEGLLVEPFVLWTSGPDCYHDYLVRGVLRAAKVESVETT